MSLTPEKLQAVLDMIHEGHTVTESLLKHEVTRKSFNAYRAKNIETEKEYVSARESRTEMLIEEIIRIADDKDIDPNRARNMIMARQWMASKVMPATYGDKIEVNHKIEASITDALTAARDRLLPLRDLETFTRNEVIETIEHKAIEITGSKPVDEPASDSEPDILS